MSVLRLSCASTRRSAALSLLVLVSFAPQDVEKELRSKDAAVREAAVRKATEEGGERAERRLLAALKDEDGLVLLAALDGLAEHGAKDALKPLLKVATEGPFRQARERAATALARCAPEAAAEALYGDLKGKDAPRALSALTALATAGARPKEVARLEKWLTHEELAVRVDAARAWIVCAPSGGRGPGLQRVLESGDLAQKAAGLEALAATGVDSDLELVAPLLMKEGLQPVLERRALAAARAALATMSDTAARAKRLERALLEPSRASAEGRTRLARLVGSMGTELPRDAARALLEQLVGDESPAVRAAAAKALGDVGGDAAPVLSGFSDGDPRVRATFVHAAARLGAATSEEGVTAFVAALRDDDRRVREAAVLALGIDGAPAAAVQALGAALADREWEIGVTAAVSLGRTRADAAIEALVKLTKHDDWRLRGAAAMGLYHVARPEIVEPLIGLVDDVHACVAATAKRALAGHAGRANDELDRKGLAAWWKENLPRVRFRTPDEVRAQRDKYGYAVSDREIYQGLDVMVVPGRGDLMESVLQRLSIEHRTIQAGQLGADGVHPFGILVAGCTGELEARDLDVVRWYVRTGGALFTSCWALTYTVDASFPGLVTKFPSPGEVLDRVQGTPVALASPYLTGVFDGGVVPIYELQGAHLIQVLDPERVEVLVDSPETALRHGSGDLAAWFRAGHGVVLDSVNHFDLQGLALATHLKEPEELMGYAVDHMGLSLQKLRDVREEKWWKSRAKAAKEVDDLSAFRILTNFVREKRMNGT